MTPNDIICKGEQAKDAIERKPEQDAVDYLVFEALTDLVNLAADQAERIARALEFIEADTMSQPAGMKRARAVLSGEASGRP